MVRKLYDCLASLNVGLWLTGGVLVLLAIGSFAGGGEGAGNINNMPLFAWLRSRPLPFPGGCGPRSGSLRSWL